MLRSRHRFPPGSTQYSNRRWILSEPKFRVNQHLESSIAINASHAWIRWFDERHAEIAKELRIVAQQKKQREVFENIDRFVLRT